MINDNLENKKKLINNNLSKKDDNYFGFINCKNEKSIILNDLN